MQSPARSSRPRRRRTAIVAVVGILALILVGVVVLPRLLTPAEASPGTEVVAATRSDEVSTVTLSGTLAPKDRANASFAVPGTVTSIRVHVGQAVSKGDALASLDDSDLTNSVTLAEANLAAARAQARTVRDTDGVTSAQIAAVDAQVAAMEATVQNARESLAEATLTSPLTGVVAEVSLEVGDQVSGSAASSVASAGSVAGVDLSGLTGSSGASAGGGSSGQIVIIEPDAWKLEATVGTADLPSMKPGLDAVVTPTGTSMEVSAVVDTVGIVATQTSGAAASFPVTLTITATDVTLFTGSDVDAVVTTAVAPDVLTVPVEAVTYTDDAATVERPDGSTTTVEVGRRFGDRQEILSGISEGDEVLVPVGVVTTAAPRVPYGPNGTLASPDPSPTSTP